MHQTHSCLGSQQFAAHHPQIRQREQRNQVRNVLFQPSVAHLHVAELALDDPKRMLDLGPHARLELLDLVDQGVDLVVLVQRPALARAHGDAPAHARSGVRPFCCALVARVGEHDALACVQQAVGLDHVVDVARGAAHRMHQARVGVHADVGLHSKEPLVALLALVHLRIALTVLVLGRAGRCDQRGIDHRAGLEQQALAAQQIVDQRQDLIGQLVLLQQMTESKDGALIRQAAVPTQAGELPEQGHVVQCFFHRRVREGEPLLHEVDAQHRLHGKGRATPLAFRCVRRHQFDPCRPGHDVFHLREEFPLAGALGRQVQAQIDLLHGSDCKHVARQVMQTFLRSNV